MGLDDSFVIPVSDTRAYKQFGNSVVMPVFKAVAEVMKPMLINEQFKPLIQDMWQHTGAGIDLVDTPATYHLAGKQGAD
jgi:DNA (cytosine-5)-methyltransferase 1